MFIIILFIATYLIMSLSKSSFCLLPYLHSAGMSITSTLWSSSYCPQQLHLQVCLCHYVLILSSVSLSLSWWNPENNIFMLLQHHVTNNQPTQKIRNKNSFSWCWFWSSAATTEFPQTILSDTRELSSQYITEIFTKSTNWPAAKKFGLLIKSPKSKLDCDKQQED